MNEKEKREQIAVLSAVMAELEEQLENVLAELDSLIESDPKMLFAVWEDDPQEALDIAERLGWDWFLDTHMI